MERPLTFPKNERLTSKTIIDDLFDNGKEIKKYPFLLKYKLMDEVHFNMQTGTIRKDFYNDSANY